MKDHVSLTDIEMPLRNRNAQVFLLNHQSIRSCCVGTHRSSTRVRILSFRESKKSEQEEAERMLIRLKFLGRIQSWGEC